jgi:hypothetical protein
MILGIVQLDGSRIIPTEHRATMRRALSRHPQETIHEYGFDQAYFLRASTSALLGDQEFTRSASRGICGVAGEPLVGSGSTQIDVDLIVEGVTTRDHRPLKDARGVFCGFQYIDGPPRALRLFGDRLGVRPLYVWQDGSLVVFATAMRMLAGLPFLRKSRDELGMLETVVYGCPLGSRTQFREVSLLRAGEVVTIERDQRTSETYWNWDRIPPARLRSDEAVPEAYRLFREAVAQRVRGDREAIAYLSGGMDSRAVVAVLRSLGVGVTAFNFSPSGSQDLGLARAFAERVGCTFHDAIRYSLPSRVLLANRMASLIEREGLPNVERPRAVWSGDGGSVSVGTVYVDKRAVDLMREGKVAEAVRHFRQLNHFQLPAGLLPRNRRTELAASLEESFLREVRLHQCVDPAQTLFLFLMVNDQRRHLNDFFEHLDVHRLEYQLPFFDGEFLEFVMSIPLDYRLEHRFYTNWFGAFPAAVREVPWQTYPGHVPCPLAIPEGLKYQWHLPPPGRMARLAAALEGVGLLLSRDAITPMSRARLAAAILMHLGGRRDYTYALEAARILRAQAP